ncbi:MAG: hypothetical protein TREMPRED_000801 [Tremellales sp. Tagirdzhanova-0007]|nr:MAG: hypothetical protein TREMPRED_000801 [Tremellales sp. Tagirdzhanova-0007]
MSKPTLLILYNASGTLLGHATYAYHHLRQSSGRECSACAITHGPRLALSESAGWTSLKARIEAGDVPGLGGHGVQVKQLHTEDLTDQIKSHMRDGSLALPCVVLEREGELSTVLRKADLDGMNGDQVKFEEVLGNRIGQLVSALQ